MGDPQRHRKPKAPYTLKKTPTVTPIPNRMYDANNHYECAHGCGKMIVAGKVAKNYLTDHEAKCDMKDTPQPQWGPYTLDARGELLCRRGCGYASNEVKVIYRHETKTCSIVTGKPRPAKTATFLERKKEVEADNMPIKGQHKRDLNGRYICRLGCGVSFKRSFQTVKHERRCGKPEKRKSFKKLLQDGRDASELAYPFLGEMKSPLTLGISYQNWRVQTLGAEYFDIPAEQPYFYRKRRVQTDGPEQASTEALDDDGAGNFQDDLESDDYQESEDTDSRDGSEDEDAEGGCRHFSFKGQKYKSVLLRNKAVLKDPNTRLPPTGPCPGIEWTHGYVKCQEKVELGISNYAFIE
ncbi:hypothetical protein ONS95_000670 [Cadophora gregata]|uniref:uncharacterized protein n=1 Tax=Cadophora gregata TaxID=51156 RepID=UPI0026DCFA8F|nr:uncharacterized protein ONS95_000670 [Cadophora gregata]KAK0125301.1 hypothetical protein ONS96_009155 [Cadophora gregata f. sp. sojae]KAK0128715.1 hypothetical protein ONS95_000670 [Cadophora gregata]